MELASGLQGLFKQFKLQYDTVAYIFRKVSIDAKSCCSGSHPVHGIQDGGALGVPDPGLGACSGNFNITLSPEEHFP